MSDWWEKPYKGGPMVPVPGFPRSLYPPDATNDGKTPSVDGPDVVAYKRTVSRAGRWPWGTFDDSYSNGFAHGKSGNVGETGIAGVQRQQGLDPTGWIGEKTFNTLRSIRVPTGPHEGEMAMDAYAADLIAKAYKQFHGNAPEGPTGPLTRTAFPSPNYSSRGGSAVRLIVIHTAEGATTIESLGSYFQGNVDASSHVGIDDTPGVIGEYVRRDYKAWTQASFNPVCVSVELCAFAKWTLAEWEQHPDMLVNCARWIAEEAGYFDLPLTKLSASQAQGSGKGVCQHADLGSGGGGHWDCGSSFPLDDVLDMAREVT